MFLRTNTTGLLWIAVVAALLQPVLAQETLPADIEWETNNDAPLIASPDAKKGGTFYDYFTTFPLTLRHVGPDSNTVLSAALRPNNLGLTTVHPNTREIIPLLATHWAYGDDKRTMYYKIDPKARWSDGEPVTADDFVYTLEFMRSKEILAPWYNTYYSEQIEKVTVYDDHTIAVTLPKPKPDLHLHADIAPTPQHFFGELTSDFPQKFNWKVMPNTGPYQVGKIKRGKSVTLERKKDWWAKDRAFFQNRFNVDRIVYRIIREEAVQWENFKKAKLDSFVLRDAEFWHDKSDIDIFQKGYAHKLWFYNDAPRGCFGIWLNSEREPLNNLEVRKGIAHAINFDKVIKSILRGEATRLESCTQGYGEYTNSDIRAKKFDPDLANTILDDAGWNERDGDGFRINAKGQKLEVELLNPADAHTQKLVVLAEEAKKIGIDLKINLKDWSAIIKQTNANKHQAVYAGFGTSLVPQFWGIWHGDNANKNNTNNQTNLNDPELNKLIEDYRGSTSKEERVSLSHQIQGKIHEASTFIPAYMRPFFREAYWRWWRLPETAATKLSGSAFEPYSPSSGGLFWWDEELEKETRKAMKSGKAFDPITVVDEAYRIDAKQ